MLRVALCVAGRNRLVLVSSWLPGGWLSPHVVTPGGRQLRCAPARRAGQQRPGGAWGPIARKGATPSPASERPRANVALPAPSGLCRLDRARSRSRRPPCWEAGGCAGLGRGHGCGADALCRLECGDVLYVSPYLSVCISRVIRAPRKTPAAQVCARSLPQLCSSCVFRTPCTRSHTHAGVCRRVRVECGLHCAQ